MVKHLPANADGFDPWVRKIPWSRKWQPTPVFLPGKFHRQRSLAGYSPWGHREPDRNERLTDTHILIKSCLNFYLASEKKCQTFR